MQGNIRLAIRLCARFVICSGIYFSGTLWSDETLPSKVRVILSRHCVECHGPDRAEAKFDLSNRDAFVRGGASGAPIDSNSTEQSLIWQRVNRDEMPPRHPLSNQEKILLRQWLENGFPWPDLPIDALEFTTESRAGRDWWSLQPITSAPIPTTSSLAQQHGPIDDFILEQLAVHQLELSPEANATTLIRRATFDLTGLPPSPADVDEFLRDDHHDRFERLLDRLLASPHYGERWGRHWLDVVRFGESNGFERDLPRPNAWPYRDWVIDSLNADLPYDEFACLQLAGDLVANNPRDELSAVGFLVAGPHDTVISVIDQMKATMRQDELEDLIGTIGQTFLGLTLNCARCHDHRFDPISAKEYYQFASAFAGIDHGERDYVATDITQQIDEINLRIETLSIGVNESSSGDKEQSSSTQKQLKKLKDQVAALTKAHTTKIYTAIATQPGIMRVHQRGSVDQLGEHVATAGLAAVRGPASDFGLRPDAIEAHRRKSLVNWITDRGNPLFVRTIVNRIWHYHLGTGLVATPNDLGFQGGRPSHPELLEWMSSDFRGSSHPFSLKRLHRSIMTSATYRQSSASRDHARAIDANNRWLWRMSPRRLEAEEVRDAMLFVSGELNREIGGQGYADFHSHFFKGTQFYDPIDVVGPAHHRRTVYRMWARGGRNPLLDQFDCPDPSTTTPRRLATVTPMQSLSLLNNAFGLRMAVHFAERLNDQPHETSATKIERAYSLAYHRKPDQTELRDGTAFIEQNGLIAFCRALLNSSEFLFID